MQVVGSKRKVLLVEPSQAFHKIFHRVLIDSQFELLTCSCAQEALNIINNIYVDIICSSYHLKDMDGIELCRQIREQTHHTCKPFLLMTSIENEFALQDALPAGVTEIFYKKDLEQLLAFIQRFPYLSQHIDASVLYVEDSITQQQITTQILTEHGIRVSSHNDAESAWQAFKQHNFDLVITDIVLSGNISGLNLVNRIRRTPGDKGDIPILAVTAFNDKTRHLELFNLGINEYLTKPIIEQDLLIRIQSIIRQQKLKQQQHEHQLAAMVYQTSSEGMFVLDNQEKIIAINPAFEAITGYNEQQALGLTANVLIAEKHQPNVYFEIYKSLQKTGQWSGELWYKNARGENFVVWLTINTLFNEDHEVIRRVGIFNNISDKLKADALVLQQANFDPLTSLPNRRLFHQYLQKEMSKANRTNCAFSLFFIDLDHFKEVNDDYGHDVGDLLLVEATERIKSCIRDSDTIARLGGDEFVLILPELDEIAALERIASNILVQLNQPFNLKEHFITLSASIGITIYPTDADEFVTLQKQADQAMYRAKKMGKNCFSFFTPSMQRESEKRKQLLSDLKVALAERQFEVYYQAIFNSQTEQLQQAEALLRWQHPELGLLTPQHFIQLAEETGLIVQIGEWLSEQVYQDQQKWMQYKPDLQLSINKSSLQLRNNNQSNFLLSAPASHTLNQLSIEFNESLLLKNRVNFDQAIQRYLAQGITICIDNYGQKSCAINELQRLGVTQIKISPQLTEHIESNVNQLAVIEALVTMLHKLGIVVIATGIETPQQKQLLKNAGCDLLQGFLLAKPLPSREFEQNLCVSNHVFSSH